jgi:hypothetical protein
MKTSKSLIKCISFIILCNLIIPIEFVSAKRKKSIKSVFSSSVSLIASEGSSRIYIKDQLLYKAMEQIVSKAQKSLVDNTEIYWNKLYLNFEEKFHPEKEEMEKNFYRKFPNPNLIQKKAFYEKLRRKKFYLFKKYAGFQKLIKSYSIKKFKNSSEKPNQYIMVVYGRINSERLLRKNYFSVIREKVEFKVNKLYIYTNINLHGASWSDLSFESGKEIEKYINQSWKSWFSQNLNFISSKSIDNIEADRVILSDDQMNLKFNEHFSLSFEFLSSLNDSFRFKNINKAYEVNSSDGQVANQVSAENLNLILTKDYPLDFYNSIWLSINCNLYVDKIEPEIDGRSMKFEVKGTFVDLKSNEIIDAFSSKSDVIKYYFLKDNTFRNTVQSFIYRMPLEKFNKFKNILKKESLNSKKIKLNVSNIEGFNEIDMLKGLISRKGFKLQIRSQIKNYGIGKAVFILDYFGREEDLKSLLVSLKGEKLKTNKVISFQSIDNPFNMELLNSFNNSEQL